MLGKGKGVFELRNPPLYMFPNSNSDVGVILVLRKCSCLVSFKCSAFVSFNVLLSISQPRSSNMFLLSIVRLFACHVWIAIALTTCVSLATTPFSPLGHLKPFHRPLIINRLHSHCRSWAPAHHEDRHYLSTTTVSLSGKRSLSKIRIPANKWS